MESDDSVAAYGLEILLIQILISVLHLNYLRYLLPNIFKSYRKYYLMNIPEIILDQFSSSTNIPSVAVAPVATAAIPAPSLTAIYAAITALLSKPQIYLLTNPILSFKLLHHLFCLSFHIPFEFPYHLYLSKCQQIHLRDLSTLFILSSILFILLSQLQCLHSQYISLAYPVIGLISLTAPYLLKGYYYCQVTKDLKLSSLGDLIDLFLGDGVRAVEEMSSSTETMANFRSYIGWITVPPPPPRYPSHLIFSLPSLPSTTLPT
jgi:hypothetical protein